MQKFDLVIRNGYVVDGTGTAAFYADVGVRNGKVVEVGNLADANADEVIDAAGKIVAPGFVNQHGHYDAMLFWNPHCPNCGENGITTIVNALCGFGLAPVRPEGRERAMQMMETTEQIPVVHQRAALTWDWESFPEYMRRVRALPKALNVVSYLPLNPLLVYVMGIDAAKSRKPTPAEIAEMHRLIHEAMDAGALGVSMSAMGVDGNTHVDFDGTPMPTDAMDFDSLIDICRAVADRGEGVIQIISNIIEYGDRERTVRLAEMAKGSGARVVHNIFGTSDAMPDLVDRDLSWLDDRRGRGLDIVAQCMPRAWIEADITQLDATGAGTLAAVREMIRRKEPEDLKTLMRDPAFRKRFDEEYRQQLDNAVASASFEGQKVTQVGPNPDLHRYVDRTLGEIAETEGKGVVEVLLDLALQSDLALQLKSPDITGNDPHQFVRLIKHPAVTIGVSDGGAHTKSTAIGQYGTDFLIWLVREEQLMSLEEMHFNLSLKPARFLSILDRGAILPGFWADILIYDLKDLYVEPRMELVYDMPNGDWRRNVRAGGYSRIFVNGVTTYENDKPTGATPGDLVQVSRSRSLPLAAE